jgi:hypothetical protein
MATVEEWGGGTQCGSNAEMGDGMVKTGDGTHVGKRAPAGPPWANRPRPDPS